MRLTVGAVAASLVLMAVVASMLPGGPGDLTAPTAFAQQDEPAPRAVPETDDPNDDTSAPACSGGISPGPPITS